MNAKRRFAAALVSLWLLWGSVFLALKVITVIPPYLTGFRFVICGATLLLWHACREHRLKSVERTSKERTQRSSEFCLSPEVKGW
ncbi:hypothetical protein [Paenibacillus alkalitolerans]|uniref:hypothetical protein n=1 Tax=Paenibacillus alkalitolerans TaxID=2799335 RepID=UPI0018F51F31|nr:hypothetical protein [Paenibacillus alkalitolerans]